MVRFEAKVDLNIKPLVFISLGMFYLAVRFEREV